MTTRSPGCSKRFAPASRKSFPTEFCKSAREGLAETLQVWARELDCEFLILLDQFEEYFLYHGAGRGRRDVRLRSSRAR